MYRIAVSVLVCLWLSAWSPLQAVEDVSTTAAHSSASAGRLSTGRLSTDRLTVAVATNFTIPMRQLASEYTTETGVDLRLVFGSSGQLFAQIQRGAPFDVFLSADTAKPLALEEAGNIESGSRRTYALGRVALWYPDADLPKVSGNTNLTQTLKAALLAEPLAILTEPLAIANPRLAPYGEAALEILEAISADDHRPKKMVYGENIAQAFHFVASGNAEAGFVALSQLLAHKPSHSMPADWRDVIIAPEALHAPIRQQMVVLNSSEHIEAAKQFQQWLLSSPIQQRIQTMGYAKNTDLDVLQINKP